MPIWASRSGLQGIRIPKRLWKGSGKATFAYRFVNCNEISMINQRFPRIMTTLSEISITRIVYSNWPKHLTFDSRFNIIKATCLEI